MEHIVKFVKQDGRELVDAKDLYNKLGLEKKNWSRWAKKMIVDNDFAVEGSDYAVYAGMTKSLMGRPSQEYALTIEMAKKLSMRTDTIVGEKWRDYFISLEKKNNENALNLPKTRVEMLRQLADAEEENLLLLAENDDMKPKADFFDEVASSEDLLSMEAVAKILDKPGVGRNNLFKILKEKRILRGNNMPFQKYISWFKVVETKFYTPGGDVKVGTKTMVKQKGLDGIRKKLEKEIPLVVY